MKRKCLNLGCGLVKLKSGEEFEWVNLDNDERCSPDVKRDMRYGLPFNDDSFDAVFCSHVLEHFGGEEFVRLMNEIHRVLKPDGELQLLSPYYKFWGAWTDPHHKMFFNEHTFEHYWFPSQSSSAIGVTGWFYPVIVEVAEEKELRVVMRKVACVKTQEFMLQTSVEENGSRVAPDWLKIVEGRKYYDE